MALVAMKAPEQPTEALAVGAEGGHRQVERREVGVVPVELERMTQVEAGNFKAVDFDNFDEFF